MSGKPVTATVAYETHLVVGRAEWGVKEVGMSDFLTEEQKRAFHRGDYVDGWRTKAIYFVISLGLIAFVALIVWQKIYDSGIELWE